MSVELNFHCNFILIQLKKGKINNQVTSVVKSRGCMFPQNRNTEKVAWERHYVKACAKLSLSVVNSEDSPVQSLVTEKGIESTE